MEEYPAKTSTLQYSPLEGYLLMQFSFLHAALYSGIMSSEAFRSQLSGIQQRLIEELGEFVKVVPVSSPAHSAMAEV